jgi:hypothetical protein
MERTVLYVFQAPPPDVFTIPDFWLSIIIGSVLPALVALVTSRVADKWIKSVLLIALSAVTGVLLEIQAGGGAFSWKQALTTAAVTFASGVVAHFGALKPLGVTGSNGVIQSAVPAGVGGHGRHEAEPDPAEADSDAAADERGSLFDPGQPPAH